MAIVGRGHDPADPVPVFDLVRWMVLFSQWFMGNVPKISAWFHLSNLVDFVTWSAGSWARPKHGAFNKFQFTSVLIKADSLNSNLLRETHFVFGGRKQEGIVVY